MQKAFVLWFADGQNTNLEQLNEMLADGWKVSSAMPMSGTGDQGGHPGYPFSRSLVILERESVP